VPAHKFVLAARNETWDKLEDGGTLGELRDAVCQWWAFTNEVSGHRMKSMVYFTFAFADWQHLDQLLGECVLRWCYTDDLSLASSSAQPDFLLRLMREAGVLGLGSTMILYTSTHRAQLNATRSLQYVLN